ncbi:hypothetical protein E4T66_03455 [Sinimarinibacterium sp. CAU 1509]|uniref:hypothetical protein n=1 Tax=Sinimarinibacterium sp. CAU 1509 TaxID=2562283 RepID=UPI0010AC3897|nr:hypothetical protein [Sinimarinibacterium sp. CAU 1509]TJY65289.1 hypothetical protein E4T66_03455 [Sinimarinibacterium sp. CAU 1509]
MSQSKMPNFQRMLHFRLRNVPDQELRVLEDDEGWLYIYRLMGTPDFGPYLKDELMSMFEIESEPWAIRQVRVKSDAEDDGERS